jgi:hypothetical protein
MEYEATRTSLPDRHLTHTLLNRCILAIMLASYQSAGLDCRCTASF